MSFDREKIESNDRVVSGCCRLQGSIFESDTKCFLIHIFTLYTWLGVGLILSSCIFLFTLEIVKIKDIFEKDEMFVESLALVFK